MRKHIAPWALLLALVVLAAPASAATITIVNNDGANEGFNDPTPVAPVGGNPGTTVGAQRLFVFQHAANIWGNLLPSAVEIRVAATFDPLSCTATSGVLGSAGPLFVVRDFPNAPFPATWYHVALGNRLAGSDQVPTGDDITTRFNSSIGQPTCLSVGWYYGVDGNEGGQIELLPVVLHELGHGLGFSTVTSGTSGSQLSGFPSVYDRFLLDLTQNLHWNNMTNAQRVSSAVNCRKLVWDGPNVTTAAPGVLGPKPLLRVEAPSPIAGTFEVGQASFGPPLDQTGVTGEVVLINDGVASPSVTDGCEPIVNNVAGKIALIDRGTCAFTVKVKNAQDAGAIGVIIADNVAGCPPAGLGGTDNTITIPSVRVTLADGNTLKGNLPLNATLKVDPTEKAGMVAGKVMMYTPNPFQGGSSVSHWDTSTEPNLLMEPAINNSLSSDVDLTLHHFADIGWLDLAVPALVSAGRVQARFDEVRIEWFAADAEGMNWTAYRRTAFGEWQAVGAPVSQGAGLLVLRDTAVVPGERYAYRVGGIRGNEEVYSEEIWVEVPVQQLAFALEGAQPNPSGRRLTVAFTLPSASPARLDLVDVAGRLMYSSEVGSRGAGRHVVRLGAAPLLRPGVYYLRLTQSDQTLSSPVVVR